MKNFMIEWGNNIKESFKYVFWLSLLTQLFVNSLNGFSDWVYILTHNPVGLALIFLLTMFVFFYCSLLLVVSFMKTVRERKSI
jgi:hypothetical protein